MNEFRFLAPCLFGIEGVAADEFRRLGFENVQTLLYEDGRHEMFNELNKEVVWDDMIAWMEKQA